MRAGQENRAQGKGRKESGPEGCAGLTGRRGRSGVIAQAAPELAGSAAPLLEITVQEIDHEAGEGLTLHQGSQLGLLVKGIGNLDGKTLHDTEPQGNDAAAIWPTTPVPQLYMAWEG